MSKLIMQSPTRKPYSPHPVLNMGFRVFFLGGALFAVITMALWMFVYTGKLSLGSGLALHTFYWHGHEMLYGYTLAIIAGFLLTAVQTWTSVTMPYGYHLLGIFTSWGLGRLCWALIAFSAGATNALVLVWLAFLFDMLFMAWLTIIITRAVVIAKQRRQIAIVSKVILLVVTNALFYIGLVMQSFELQRIGIYLGLYFIIGLVLTVGRRVFPFFLEKGLSVGQVSPITVKNSKALDVLSLVFYLVFCFSDVFFDNPFVVSISALATAAVNMVRLINWHHPGIWKKPLLWSLYLAFWGMVGAFILFALQAYNLIGNHFIAVHALVLSGIGLMTIAMMSRVALGHTGRNIHQPPKTVPWIFLLMIATFVTRVILPLFAMESYILWVMIAHTTWLLSFIMYCISYTPILSKERIDGAFG